MADRHQSGVITLHSNATVDRLLRRAVALVEERGLDVLAVIDHSGDAAEAGVDMPEAKLVLIGSPLDLTELVVARPSLAIELPLKMLLWAGGVDGAFVTYHAADDVADRFELTGTEVEAWRLVDAIAHQVVAGP